MNASLTERYIAATITQLPENIRNDVEPELRASITDAVDVRVVHGEDPETAERAVLNDLGDPTVLAAGYAERPLHLIGSKYYVVWAKVLKQLLVVLLPLVAVLVAFAQVLARAPIGTMFAESIVATLSTGLHICFWVTLAFAIMDRTGTDLGTAWNVDELPEPQEEDTGRIEMVASLVFLVLFFAAIVWDQTVGFVQVVDERISILSPDLWPWAMAALLAIIVLEMLFAIALYARGGWDVWMASMNTVLAVLFFSWVISLLSRGQLFSTEFLSLAPEGGIGSDDFYKLSVLFGFGVAIICFWNIIDGWVKAYRAGSSSIEQ